MSELFLERNFDPGITSEDIWQMAEGANDCFDRHRVSWHCSYLGLGGTRMICNYRAPDLDSARIAMRELGADINVFWSGTVHNGAGITDQDLGKANVLVERDFPDA